jgi:hypothetical protein
MPDNKLKWLSRRAQAKRYGRTARTIRRWEIDPSLNYPPGIEIKGQWYRAEDDLDAWDAARATLQPAIDMERCARARAYIDQGPRP